MKLATRTLILLSGAALLIVGLASVPSGPLRPPPPDATREPDSVPGYRLAGRELYAPPTLGAPTALLVRGDRLVVLDPFRTAPVLVLRGTDGALLRETGRKGDGPGEYRGPISLLADPVDADAFWVLDAQLGRLTRLSAADDAVGSGSGGADSILSLPAVRATDVAWLERGRLAAVGFFDDTRVVVLDAGGRETDRIGRIPTPDRPVPQAVLAHAWRATLRVRPDGRRLAVATRFAGHLEVIDGAGRVATAAVPHAFEPVYEVRASTAGPYLVQREDTRFGYVDMAATRNRIFALWSGRTNAEGGEAASLGRRVHVFDWTGALRATLVLDADVLAVAVDPLAGRLFAVRHLPVPGVLVYPLPAPLRARDGLTSAGEPL